MNSRVTTLLLGVALFVSLASALPLRKILQQSFNVGVITDTYQSFNSSLQLTQSVNFEESLRATAVLQRSSSVEVSDDGVPVYIEVDLDSTNSQSGTLQLYFYLPSGDVPAEVSEAQRPNITMPFSFVQLGDTLECSGEYKTNRLSYGTYWWRFSSDNEFVLQFVDHIFSNTTTIHGFAKPTSDKKPWWQNWGLVLVTLGVFVVKLWLGGLQARRVHRSAAKEVSQMKLKKTN